MLYQNMLEATSGTDEGQARLPGRANESFGTGRSLVRRTRPDHDPVGRGSEVFIIDRRGPDDIDLNVHTEGIGGVRDSGDGRNVGR